MKSYWKKTIISTMAMTFMTLFVATQSGTAQEVHPVTSKDISYEPFTIEHQMELVQEEQLLLAMKNEKEKIEKEKIEQERLEKERLEKERLEKERLERERLEKERIEKEKAEQAKREAEQARQATKNSQTNSSAQSTPINSKKSITVTSTAYTASCTGCSGITRTGINLHANPNAKVIAVDPNVIPLGSKVYVPGYGEAIAGDTGGAIKGNKIDVFFPSNSTARQWGVKTITIQILSTP